MNKFFEIGHHESNRPSPRLSDEWLYEEDLIETLERWGDRTYKGAQETERSYRFQD